MLVLVAFGTDDATRPPSPGTRSVGDSDSRQRLRQLAAAGSAATPAMRARTRHRPPVTRILPSLVVHADDGDVGVTAENPGAGGPATGDGRRTVSPTARRLSAPPHATRCFLTGRPGATSGVPPLSDTAGARSHHVEGASGLPADPQGWQPAGIGAAQHSRLYDAAPPRGRTHPRPSAPDHGHDGDDQLHQPPLSKPSEKIPPGITSWRQEGCDDAVETTSSRMTVGTLSGSTP